MRPMYRGPPPPGIPPMMMPGRPPVMHYPSQDPTRMGATQSAGEPKQQ